MIRHTPRSGLNNPSSLPDLIASPSPSSILVRIALLFKYFGVIDVMTAQSVAPRRTIMTTFTIDSDNNITAFGTPEEAAATTTTPFDTFASQKELAELAAAWPAERLVEIWNSLAGVVAVESFKSAKTAVSRIWARIQRLGGPEKPKADPEKPKAHKKAKGSVQAAKGSPAKAKATKKASPAKNPPKAKKAAKARESAGPREGSKTEQVIAMLKRKNGATLAEIMATTRWLSHTTRAFVSATLGKKLGLAVESFKSDKGERTYRINQ
jgi:hypothetical protein